MSDPVTIGIDLGGTNVKAALVRRDGSVVARETRSLETQWRVDGYIDQMVDAVEAVVLESGAERGALVGVGIGSPGPLSVRRGVVLNAANIPGFAEVPLRDQLAQRLGLPAVLDNDANAAAFGEYVAGAGQDAGYLVMLTLGTGVGAGVIIDGRVLHGHFENAAELGHTIVVPDGLPCPCGQRGCLEQYASAAGVARRAQAAIAAGETGALLSHEKVDARAVAACAAQGDPLADRVWNDACRYLAIACINIQHAYNPQVVVLGGGMSLAGDVLLQRVLREVEGQRWTLCEDVPRITLATLGYDAGVIGAACLAWQAFGGNG